jgi:predicted peptidase
VWFHGFAKAGTNNTDHLAILEKVLRPPWNRERYDFFVLAIQCPPDNPYWTQLKITGTCDDMINVAEAIIRRTLQDHPIDPLRICFAGASSGGAGCWRFALKYPEYPAAIAPLASNGLPAAEFSSLHRIAHIPVWAFHSRDDTSTPIRLVSDTVSALDASGGIAQLTAIDSDEHDCWTAALDHYHLIEWLVSQNRDNSSWLRRPSVAAARVHLADIASSWTPSQLLGQVSLVGIILLLLWRRRLRQREFAANPCPVFLNER